MKMLFAVLALLMLPLPAAAQQVSTADIQRLQDDVYQASSELREMRGSETEITRLQRQLDDLREEVIYLKVKMRKGGVVTRTEYLEVQDRLRTLRAQARGEEITERRPRPSSTSVIPAGQEIDVRLQSQLSSATAEVEDRFEATTIVDLYRGNEVLIPAGSVVRGIVRTVDRATRTDRKGELTVSFDQVTVRGRTYPMRGTVTQAIESEGIKGEGKRVGTGSAIGGIIGGIIGGFKGALLGILIGGGGTIAATPGKDVTLPPGTILRVRLDTPPDIR